MNENHLSFLRERLEENLPGDLGTIRKVWEVPGFKEAAWKYRGAMVPELTLDEAKEKQPSCGGLLTYGPILSHGC